MSRFIPRVVSRLAFGAVATLVPIAATSVSAGATGESSPERAVEAICDAQGGTLVNHRFQRVRCQQVPPSTMRDPLLRVAEALCERQLDATFAAGPTFGDDDSITWICS